MYVGVDVFICMWVWMCSYVCGCACVDMYMGVDVFICMWVCMCSYVRGCGCVLPSYVAALSLRLNAFFTLYWGWMQNQQSQKNKFAMVFTQQKNISPVWIPVEKNKNIYACMPLSYGML